MDNNITISTIPPSRWQEYRDLRLEALIQEPLAYSSSAEDNSNLTEENWRAHLDPSTSITFFAQLQNQLIGNVTVVQESKPKLRHIANIYGVYVKPEHRGKQIGRQLLIHVIEHCKNQPHISKIKISVNPTQIPALKLYHSLGFRLIGECEQEMYVDNKYYSEYLMEMIIKPSA